MKPQTFFIAEAGVNHNGSLALALELVEIAKEAGADAVKFQTFSAERLVTSKASMAEYQKKNTNSQDTQQNMLKSLELSEAHHKIIKTKCNELGIEFMSTPFDVDSVDFLVNELKVSRLKVASPDITNGPLLLKMARTGLPIILSTGMSIMEEIIEAISIFAFAEANPFEYPKNRQALTVFQDPSTWSESLKKRLMLLHCVSQYPAPFEATNLYAMDLIREITGLRVGLSDHSETIEIALAAVARGALVIEKHFTKSKSLPGPDHAASLEPQELSALIKGIRNVEVALGEKIKIPTVEELKNQMVVRSSLVAKRALKKDEEFSEDNITVKRPGTGVSPLEYWDFLNGKKASRHYDTDDFLENNIGF